MRLSRVPKLGFDLLRNLLRQPEQALQFVQNIPFGLRGLDMAESWPTGPSTAAAGANGSGVLRDYFEKHRTGPGIWKWLHYFESYERHFSRFVGREVNVLEIGVYSGGSLAMWRDYFGPGLRLYGVDIQPSCRAYADDRTQIFIGDQGDRSFWQRVRAEAPPFDIVIDDGGHMPEQQIVTLEELLPHVRPGGVYWCEDIGGEANQFSMYVRTLADRLNAMRPLHTLPDGSLKVDATRFQSAIHSVHFYPFVCVIEKRDREIAELRAPKHGTTWEPFY